MAFTKRVTAQLNRWWDKVPDMDTVFAYDTVREVRVLDRRLGLVYYFIIVSVAAYIIVGVFLINKQHLDQDKSNGQILTEVRHTGRDKFGLPWDVFDVDINPGESGATFVPTRVVVTKGQTEDGTYCPSPLHTCERDNDCDIDNDDLQKPKCVSGMCMRRQYCPAENPENPAVSQTHELDFGETELRFKSYVHFNRFLVDVSTVHEKMRLYPRKHANAFAVKDLLRMANLEDLEVASNGGIIMLTSLLDCDLDARLCDVQFKVANVDTKTGFNFVVNQWYWENGKRKRDMYRMYGIRLQTFATGIGTRVSISMIILQFSSALALLGTATTAADFVLQYMVPERKHYTSQKILETEDFNVDPEDEKD